MAHENSNKTQTTRRNLENYLTYKMKKKYKLDFNLTIIPQICLLQIV